MTSLSGLPLFEAHSEPKPKRKHRRTGPQTFVTKRPTHCSALRRLMADGRWYSLHEIMVVGGTRAPGRLHDVSRGIDGCEPRAYEVARHPDDTTRTFYRLCVGERPPFPWEGGR